MPRCFALIVRRASVIFALALLVGCGSYDEVREQSGEIAKRGGKIAYTAFRCGPGSISSPDQVFLVSAAGSDDRPLAPRDAFGGSSPAWSPDGTKIAFARWDGEVTRPNGRVGEGLHGLAVVKPNGTALKTLVRGYVADPAWSPDGTRIAFAMSVGRGESAIYVWGTNGHLSRLTEPRGYGNPTWSPDGKRIAFHQLRSRETGESDWRKASIYTIKADGRDQPRPLGSGAEPDWSPKGEEIVFTRYFIPPGWDPDLDEVGADLYVMNAGGGERKRLTAAPAANGREASWSQDGKEIVFVSTRAGDLPHEVDDGPFEGIWIMSGDGTSPRRISVNEYGCTIGQPDWQPLDAER